MKIVVLPVHLASLWLPWNRNVMELGISMEHLGRLVEVCAPKTQQIKLTIS